MHPELPEPTFLVDAYSDPVCLKINGRASYLNCAPLGDFFHNLIKRKKLQFAIDFSDCTGMDSTFLGMIAGIALELKDPDSEGDIQLYNIEDRNLELIQNLGLNRILTINTGNTGPKPFFNSACDTLTSTAQANGKKILEAHENLIKADGSNTKKFQDVLSFLKKQINEDAESS